MRYGSTNKVRYPCGRRGFDGRKTSELAGWANHQGGDAPALGRIILVIPFSAAIEYTAIIEMVVKGPPLSPTLPCERATLGRVVAEQR